MSWTLCSWTPVGNSTAFSELTPPAYKFLYSPSTPGSGSGLASVYKSKFLCWQIQHTAFASFELQLFEIILSYPVLCVVVYRPPKFNKDFIHDFADFLSGIIVNYDFFVICSDFNVHACCESQPLTRDFINLLDFLPQAISLWSYRWKGSHLRSGSLSWSICRYDRNMCDVCFWSFTCCVYCLSAVPRCLYLPRL